MTIIQVRIIGFIFVKNLEKSEKFLEKILEILQTKKIMSKISRNFD